MAPASPKPGEMTSNASTPAEPHARATSATSVGSNHRQLDRLGKIENRCVGSVVLNCPRVAVDGIQVAGEAGANHVAQGLCGDGGRLGAGADDRDRYPP